MNKRIIQTIAILFAFFIGVSINSSCGNDNYGGDNIPNGGNTSYDDDITNGDINILREELLSFKSDIREEISSLKSDIESYENEISKLQSEIADLKTKIADLESNDSNGGNSNGDENTCGEFMVDGLWFNRDGNINEKVKIHCGTYDPGSRYASKYEYHYFYDDYGRVSKIEYYGDSSYYGFSLSSYEIYEYTGKTLNIKQYDRNNIFYNTTTYEYY